MVRRASPHTRVPQPLRLSEWLKVAGLAAIVMCAGALGWWTCSSGTEAENAIQQLFHNLEQGHHDAAFALLSPPLQEELGSPEVLAERWRATRLERVRVGDAIDGCSSHVPGVTLRVDAETRRARDAAVVPLQLGDVSRFGTTCKSRPMPLVAHVQDGKIVALRLTR